MSEKLKISLILGIMCVFLAMGISIQINTVGSSSTTVGKTLVENELRDSVFRWQEKYENAYKKLEEKEKELNSLRDNVSSKDNNNAVLTSKLKNYNLLLGETELVGKGVIVTLDDGDATILSNNVTSLLVHDGDVLEVVNSLKNAGAEAISVNDQRIVSTTSISCAGNIILINGEKVGAPFVIKAIGSPIMLNSSVTMGGGYIEQLIKDGVKVDVQQVEKENIVIPRYEGVYQYKYATIYE